MLLQLGPNHLYGLQVVLQILQVFRLYRVKSEHDKVK